MNLVKTTIEYAAKKQPSVLLILFSLILDYIQQERDRIEQLNDAEIRYLGKKYSIPLKKLQESLEFLKNAKIEQTGKYSFRISPFKD